MRLTAFGYRLEDHRAWLGGRHVEALFSLVEGSPGLWGFPASSREDKE